MHADVQLLNEEEMERIQETKEAVDQAIQRDMERTGLENEVDEELER